MSEAWDIGEQNRLFFPPSQVLRLVCPFPLQLFGFVFSYSLANNMPRRTDIKKILLVGSGPIVIGQACEFDYSGTQACKALREEGYEVVLVNSNPATIMTDPETADRTYIEPLTPDLVAKVIEKERPDALLPTMGGTNSPEYCGGFSKEWCFRKIWG